MNEAVTVFGILALTELVLFVMLCITNREGYVATNESNLPEVSVRSDIQTGAQTYITFMYVMYHLPFILFIIFLIDKPRVLSWVLLVITPITYTIAYCLIRGIAT